MLWTKNNYNSFSHFKQVITICAGRYPKMVNYLKDCVLSFAVHAVNLVPITKVNDWLGHSNLEITTIYIQVNGIEDREGVEKLWGDEQ